MYKAFLIKYGEIGVKGKNRFIFEDALVRQIKFSLKDVEGEFDVRRADGRIYVNALSDYDYDEVIESLSCCSDWHSARTRNLDRVNIDYISSDFYL